MNFFTSFHLFPGNISPRKSFKTATLRENPNLHLTDDSNPPSFSETPSSSPLSAISSSPSVRSHFKIQIKLCSFLFETSCLPYVYHTIHCIPYAQMWDADVIVFTFKCLSRVKLYKIVLHECIFPDFIRLVVCYR